MRKPIIMLATLLVAASTLFAQGTKEEIVPTQPKRNVVASTSWTAAFADLAGIDGVQAIAPASLRHPPEYEITVSDIKTVKDSDIFIYAGFERMMKTIGDSVGDVKMVKVQCDNSIETVKKNAAPLSELTGTQEESRKRVDDYVAVIENARKEAEEKGLKGAKALVNKNQIYLAGDLGLDIAGTFGPGPVTSAQIADAKDGGYLLIIDNVHNPVGSPLAEVAANAKYVIWRNFPEKVEHDALKHVIESNLDALRDAFTK